LLQQFVFLKQAYFSPCIPDVDDQIQGQIIFNEGQIARMAAKVERMGIKKRIGVYQSVNILSFYFV
jgi:hypothetical protein